MDDNINKIIRDVSSEHGIAVSTLEKAWRNQFKVLRNVIQSCEKDNHDSFKIVYIKNIGKFIPKRKRITWMMHNIKDGKRIGNS
jgi:hypothetical protein